MPSSYSASAVLVLPGTLEGGSYPDVTLRYGLAGTSGSAAELGTLAFLFGNTGSGGNAMAIVSATLPSIVFLTLADKREWMAVGFDTNAFGSNIPGSFVESSAIDVPVLSGSVTGATNASPIVITATAHSMGAVGTILPVTISAVGGNTAANAFWWALVTDANHFSLISSTGNGAYTSGGTWQTNQTAGSLSMHHTSDYKGAAVFGAYKILTHDVDGTFTINDRIGRAAITLNAAGTTLTLNSGGNVTTIACNSNLLIGTNKAVILDTVGDVGATHPKAGFTNGAGGIWNGLYTTNGSDVGVSVNNSGTTISAFLCAGDGTTTFNKNATVPGLIVQTNGTTYLILKDTNVGGGKEWEITMQDDGKFHIDYFNGSSRINPLLIDITGKISAIAPIVLANFTVATLPSASTSGAGATAFVTDASTTIVLSLGLTVLGSGSNKVPVYSDGTNWIVG